MAESKGSKRYNHGPKIQDKEPAGDTVSGGGAPEKASKTAEKTAASAKAEDNTPDPGPKADVMAGTDGIPVMNERHAAQREDAHHQAMRQMQDLHARHQMEQRNHADGGKEDLHSRHEIERRVMNTNIERAHRAMHQQHENEMGKSAAAPSKASSGASMSQKNEGSKGT